MAEARTTTPSSLTVTLPDGSTREYAAGVTGLEIAESIAKSLAKAAVAIKVNGAVWDLSRPLDGDANVAIIRQTQIGVLNMQAFDYQRAFSRNTRRNRWK